MKFNPNIRRFFHPYLTITMQEHYIEAIVKSNPNIRFFHPYLTITIQEHYIEATAIKQRACYQ